MGLAYHNHSALPPLDTISEHRYFPSAPGERQYRKPAYQRRCHCWPCTDDRRIALNINNNNKKPRGGRNEPRRHRHCYVDSLEAAALVHDGAPLPGEYVDRANRFAQLQKRPSLERQEAFRDPTTSKNNSRASSVARTGSLSRGDTFTYNNNNNNGSQGDLEVAELYRLGLLYDDEHVRGSGFTLDVIVHEDPVYAVRPAKRRRHGGSRKRAESLFSEVPAELPLELSFAELGKDEVIARYLISNPDFEFGAKEYMEELFARGDGNTTAPTTVVDGLGEEEAIDKDEALESHAALGKWQQDGVLAEDTLPDLVSDEGEAEEEGAEEDEVEEDWTFLPTPVSERARTPIQQLPLQQEQQTVNQDTWIMLGDDS